MTELLIFCAFLKGGEYEPLPAVSASIGGQEDLSIHFQGRTCTVSCRICQKGVCDERNSAQDKESLASSSWAIWPLSSCAMELSFSRARFRIPASLSVLDAYRSLCFQDGA